MQEEITKSTSRLAVLKEEYQAAKLKLDIAKTEYEIRQPEANEEFQLTQQANKELTTQEMNIILEHTTVDLKMREAADRLELHLRQQKIEMEHKILKAEQDLDRLKFEIAQAELDQKISREVKQASLLDAQLNTARKALLLEEAEEFGEDRFSVESTTKRARLEIERLQAEKELLSLQPTEETELDKLNKSADAYEAERKARVRMMETEQINIFTTSEDTPFSQNFDRLRTGKPIGLSQYFLPTCFVPNNKHYILDGGPSTYIYTGAIRAEHAEFEGWEKSLLIAELRSKDLNKVIATRATARFAVGVATGVTLGVVAASLVKKLGVANDSANYEMSYTDNPLADIANEYVKATTKAVAGTVATTAVVSGVASTILTMADAATLSKKVELRARVRKITGRTNDTRPLEDRQNEAIAPDRLVELDFFVVVHTVSGHTIISFDPVFFGLFELTKSSYYTLGVIATDENREFRTMTISEAMFYHSVSRHSLPVSEFQKKRAIERILKILEMDPKFNEDHQVRFDIGRGVYEDTLHFASLVVTKDAYNRPSTF